MKEIAILEVLYNLSFTITSAGNLAYERTGEAPLLAEQEKITSLLDAVKKRKVDAIAYLRSRQTVEDAFPAILEAAEDCERAARKAEKHGNLPEARRLWVQYGKFWQVVEADPIIPWADLFGADSGKPPVD